MNKEIKEILDYLKDNNKSFIICGSSYYKISDYKAKVLLDYITNLQEENEKLQKDKDRVVSEREDLLSSCLYQDKIIKKAIEYIEKQKEITENYKFALSHIECDKVLSILRGEDNENIKVLDKNVKKEK